MFNAFHEKFAKKLFDGKLLVRQSDSSMLCNTKSPSSSSKRRRVSGSMVWLYHFAFEFSLQVLDPQSMDSLSLQQNGPSFFGRKRNFPAKSFLFNVQVSVHMWNAFGSQRPSVKLQYLHSNGRIFFGGSILSWQSHCDPQFCTICTATGGRAHH